MKNFKDDLRKKGLSEGSIQTYSRHAVEFLNWLEQECEEAQNCTYTTILHYIEDCKSKHYAQSTIQLHIESIKKYLDHLGLDPNPAKLQLRPRLRQLPNGLLNEEELQMIYNGYPKKYLRNKVVLGLILFQALRLKELRHLHCHSINLESGTITIPKSKKTNGRILSLQATQIALLQSYLQDHENEIMFPVAQMNYVVSYIMKQLKRTYPYLKTVRQLRASVITNWLRHSNLRQVQYMAGHRYVSSTERYQMNHLEDLQRDLDKFHPMK